MGQEEEKKEPEMKPETGQEEGTGAEESAADGGEEAAGEDGAAAGSGEAAAEGDSKAAGAEAAGEAQEGAEATPPDEAPPEGGERGGEEAPGTGLKEQELAAREKALEMREMRAAAVEELAAGQLPTALADCFNYDTQESYQKSKEAVVKAFQGAVKDAVNTRLRGNGPPRGGTSSPGSGNARSDNFAEIVRSQRSRK